jgi:hypothetical protein
VDRRTLFEAWAPGDGPWSPWAKPILFAYVDAIVVVERLVLRPAWVRDELLSTHDESGADGSSLAGRSTAIVVDLPGVDGVAVGLALAELGFRPVPLYNALPSPEAVVPMDDVIRTIIAGAELLLQRPPPPHAPPAFLLDARRAGPRGFPRRGQFDNRSMAFETDFPSPARLKQAGIVDVVLIQSHGDAPAPDLLATLADWQNAGMAIRRVRADDPSVATRIVVPRVGLLRRFFQWARRGFLRGSPHLGFGGSVPHGG